MTKKLSRLTLVFYFGTSISIMTFLITIIAGYLIGVFFLPSLVAEIELTLVARILPALIFPIVELTFFL